MLSHPLTQTDAPAAFLVTLRYDWLFIVVTWPVNAGNATFATAYNTLAWEGPDSRGHIRSCAKR